MLTHLMGKLQVRTQRNHASMQIEPVAQSKPIKCLGTYLESVPDGIYVLGGAYTHTHTHV